MTLRGRLRSQPLSALLAVAIILAASCGQANSDQNPGQQTGPETGLDVTSFFGDSQNIGELGFVPGGVLVAFDKGTGHTPALARCELENGCQKLLDLVVPDRRLTTTSLATHPQTGTAAVVALSCPEGEQSPCSQGARMHVLRVGPERGVDLRATLGANRLPSLDGAPPITVKARFVDDEEVAVAVGGNEALTAARVDLEAGDVALSNLGAGALAALSSGSDGSIVVGVSEKLRQEEPVVRRPGGPEVESTDEATRFTIYSIGTDGAISEKQLPAPTDRVVPYEAGILQVTDRGRVLDSRSEREVLDDGNQAQALSTKQIGRMVRCEGSPGHGVLTDSAYDPSENHSTTVVRWLDDKNLRGAEFVTRGSTTVKACAQGDAVLALVSTDAEPGLEETSGGRIHLRAIS